MLSEEGFKVTDTQTGEEPDLEEIALNEDWAKELIYCDMEGFALQDDGTLILCDETGRFVYCPEGRFKIELALVARTRRDVLEEIDNRRLLRHSYRKACGRCEGKGYYYAPIPDYATASTLASPFTQVKCEKCNGYGIGNEDVHDVDNCETCRLLREARKEG